MGHFSLLQGYFLIQEIFFHDFFVNNMIFFNLKFKNFLVGSFLIGIDLVIGFQLQSAITQILESFLNTNTL